MKIIIAFLLFSMAQVVYADLCYSPSCRSENTVHAFRKQNPCPATGKTTGACSGWVVDHKIPLCSGQGADDPSNMQWQAVAPSHVKDKEEWKLCRLINNGESVCNAANRLKLPVMIVQSCGTMR